MLCLVIIGNIIHCDKQFSLKIYEKGFLIVHGSKIKAIGELDQFEAEKERLEIDEYEKITLRDSQVLLPGLIDTHIHAPQYPNIGLGYDMPLMQWLDKYTFPVEAKFDDLEYAARVYDAVVKRTLSYGTTTASYFGNLYTNSSIVLAECIHKHGQRAFVGKVNMIRNSPDYYVETFEESIKHTKQFVKEILNKNNDLLQPIITPRFAISVNNELMLQLSEIAEEFDLNIQTHIAENCDEVANTRLLYGMDYADVYDKAGLLTKKTILAHGIYLNDNELRLISRRGASISHCPSSNVRLQSGLCNVRKLMENGINVGLGTDVSGGCSMSIIAAMRYAIDTSIYLSFNEVNSNPLTYSDAFYMGTLGGAKALALDDKIGNFDIGKDFDAIIIDMNVKQSSSDDLFMTYTADELLQKFIYVGDDRNIIHVYVAGNKVK